MSCCSLVNWVGPISTLCTLCTCKMRNTGIHEMYAGTLAIIDSRLGALLSRYILNSLLHSQDCLIQPRTPKAENQKLIWHCVKNKNPGWHRWRCRVGQLLFCWYCWPGSLPRHFCMHGMHVFYIFCTAGQVKINILGWRCNSSLRHAQYAQPQCAHHHCLMAYMASF